MATTISALRVVLPSQGTLLNGDIDQTVLGERGTRPPEDPSSFLSDVTIDPLLQSFWSGFPCPPPWNQGLLLQANWSSCVGDAVGEKLKWILAERCNIPHDASDILSRPPSRGNGSGLGQNGGGGREEQDVGRESGEIECGTSCIVLVTVLCSCLILSALIAGVCIAYRRRTVKKDQRPNQPTQTTAGARRDPYVGIHYASAPVVNREHERPLPPCPDRGRALPRQLQAYVYNPPSLDVMHDRLFHLHLCPLNRRADYRVMAPSTRAPSLAYSETSHVYDSISDHDTESVSYWRRGQRGVTLPEFCTCDYSDSSMAVEYCASTPRQSEGYYSDHDHNKQEDQRRLKACLQRIQDSAAESYLFNGMIGAAPDIVPDTAKSLRFRTSDDAEHVDDVNSNENIDSDCIVHNDGIASAEDVQSRRVNALALHPGYFEEYFDVGHSSA